MDTATGTDRAMRDADEATHLRAKLRAATRWSIAPGVDFVAAGLPIAGNEAFALAMRRVKWDGELPRRVRR